SRPRRGARSSCRSSTSRSWSGSPQVSRRPSSSSSATSSIPAPRSSGSKPEEDPPRRCPPPRARAARSLGRTPPAAAAAGLGWGLIEAARPRLRVLELELRGLPEELDGLRIAHLSDFHFGVPSPGIGAVWQAAAWVRERRPDLVAITGDLLTHPRGEPMLRRLVRLLPRP